MGKTVVYTHGDLYSVKSSKYGLMELAETTGADIVLFGHTHSAYLDYVSVNSRGVFLFNPGSASSTSYPSTYGIIEINEKGVFFSNKSL
jgi:putative phosphoesterase